MTNEEIQNMKAGRDMDALISEKVTRLSYILYDGTDIRTIQELLGHSKLETTMIYVHLEGGAAVRSPLDRLSAGTVIRHAVVES